MLWILVSIDWIRFGIIVILIGMDVGRCVQTEAQGPFGSRSWINRSKWRYFFAFKCRFKTFYLFCHSINLYSLHWSKNLRFHLFSHKNHWTISKLKFIRWSHWWLIHSVWKKSRWVTQIVDKFNYKLFYSNDFSKWRCKGSEMAVSRMNSFPNDEISI